MPSEDYSQTSARKVDANGFITIESNPIIRSGVFPYLGKSISGTLDPNKIYFVYRPAEELKQPECIDSLKHIPFIDDHAFLGPEELGYVPAEKKGVHGTTGERVDFNNEVMYADLKIFSETLSDLIESGKDELSLGYRCKYDYEPGTFAGQSYDFVQRSIRGNHIALVKKGRNDVSVLDSGITLDHFDLEIKQEENTMTLTLDEAVKELATLKAANAKLQTAMDAMEDEKKEKEAKDAEEEKKEKEAKDAEEKEKADKEAKDAECDKDKMKGMDAKIVAMDAQIETLKKNGIKALRTEISKTNQLAAQLQGFVGTFDHSEMTLDEVAAYGVDKLKIRCDKGNERIALDAWLQGRGEVKAGSGNVIALDAKPSKGFDDYLSNKKA